MIQYYDCMEKEIKYMNYRELGKLSWSKNLTINKIRRCKSNKNPNAKWDFRALTHHPNLTLEWLLELPDGDWDFSHLSYLSTLNEKWFQSFPTASWKFDVLSRQNNIHLSWLLAIPEAKWNFNVFSCYHRLDTEWIRNFPNGNWNVTRLVKHKNFSVEWIKLLPDLDWDTSELALEHLHIRNLESFPHLNWNFKKASEHIQLDLSWLLKFPKAKWDFKILSRHVNFEYAWMEEFPKAKWDFKHISKNMDLELSWLLNFQQAPWDFNFISSNPKLDIQWFYRFPNGNWNVRTLSEHPNLIPRWFEVEIFNSWDWDYGPLLRKDSAFKLSWVIENPNYNWSFWALSQHPDLTLDFVKKFKNRGFNMKEISFNPAINEEWFPEFNKTDWNLRFMSHNVNFQFSWLQFFPEGDWLFDKISCFEPWTNNSLHRRIRPWQYLNTLTLPVLQKYQTKPWNIDFLLQHKKLTIDWLIATPYLNWTHYNFIDMLTRRKSLKGTPLHQKNPQVNKMVSLIQTAYQEQNFMRVKFLYECVKQKVVPTDISSMNPENINQPLELQDLSGDIYYIPDWFYIKNILRDIRKELIDLGYFDIYVDSKEDENGRVFTHRQSPLIKRMLLEMKDYPNAMIVYRD